MARDRRGGTLVRPVRTRPLARAAAGKAALVAAAYLALALWVGWPLISHPGRLSPGGTGDDETLTSWFLAHTAWAIAHLSDPFVTDRLGVPDGVNLATQASMTGLGAPLAPLTLAVGAPTSLAVLIVSSPVATGLAWYWLLGKLRLHWFAAGIAAALVAFNPQELAEATGRNHVAMGALIPVIVWKACTLTQAGRLWRRGLVLGALATWQALIGEEMLLLLAGALVLYCGTWLALEPKARKQIRRVAAGLCIAAAVAGVLLAYPLWRQFVGPGHIDAWPGYDQYHAWLSTYTGLPPAWSAKLSAGNQWWAASPPGVLGLAAMTTAGISVLVSRRRPVVVCTAVVTCVFAVLSLGSTIHLRHRQLPGPWSPLAHLPIAQAVLTNRMLLVVAAGACVLVGYGLDAALRGSWLARCGYALLIGAAMYQLAPTPYPAFTPDPVPAFITSGAWRPYLTGGRALVTVPVTNMFWGDGQRWATATGTEMAIAGGYYLAPGDGKVLAGARSTWTSRYFEATIAAGKPPAQGSGDGQALWADMRYWHAGALVLSQRQVYAAALRCAVARLLGPGMSVGGVWLWDVRALTDAR